MRIDLLTPPRTEPVRNEIPPCSCYAKRVDCESQFDASESELTTYFVGVEALGGSPIPPDCKTRKLDKDLLVKYGRWMPNHFVQAADEEFDEMVADFEGQLRDARRQLRDFQKRLSATRAELRIFKKLMSTPRATRSSTSTYSGSSST